MGKLDEISAIARPTMGDEVPLVIFRAFRHFSADYVRKMLGRGAGVVFQNSGLELGREAGALLKKPTFDEYLGEVVRFVRNLKIGELKATQVTSTALEFQLDECITCAGMAPGGERICHFEVGFVAGVVEAFMAQRVRATETLCNYMGEPTCQITIDLAVDKVRA